MKKILLISLFACLLSCNSNIKNSNNKESSFISSNNSSANIGSNNNNTNSSINNSVPTGKPIIPETNIDDEFDEFGKKVYGRNAKENLLSLHRICRWS